MKLSKISKLFAASNTQTNKEGNVNVTNQISKIGDDLELNSLHQKSTENRKSLFIPKNNLIKKMSFEERIVSSDVYLTPKKNKKMLYDDSNENISDEADPLNKNKLLKIFKKKLPSKNNSQMKSWTSNVNQISLGRLNSLNVPSKEPLKKSITFSSLFEDEGDDIKNKKLIGQTQKRPKEFTEKLEMIIKNKFILRSSTESFRNQFFESFTETELERLHQNNFKSKFQKIMSLIKIDKRALNTFLQKKSLKKKNKENTQTFLSGSEDEEENLVKVFSVQPNQDLNVSEVNLNSHQILDQDEIEKVVHCYARTSSDSTQLGSSHQNITSTKSYNLSKDLVSSEDTSIRDMGKFLYVNPKWS